MRPQEINPFLKLLPGKSDRNNTGKWLPVWMHLEDTAGIMEKLVVNWLSPNIVNYFEKQIETGDAVSICKMIAYLHDIGKFTPVFASRILGNLPEIRQALEHNGIDIPDISFFLHNSPHALAGQCILRERNIPGCISAIVGAHHGAPQENLNSEDMEFHPENYYGRMGDAEPYKTVWNKVWDQWIEYALLQCGYHSVDELPVVNQSAQILLTGLLIMADWIASNPTYFPLINIDAYEPETPYSDRINHAWNRFNKKDMYIWEPEIDFNYEHLFENRFGFLPNEIQCAFMDVLNQSTGTGIYILEAPMGSGKTEAALFAAEALAAKTGTSGVFFGLPTQATANGIFTRLLPWAEKQSEETVHSIRLAHGMAELNEDYIDLFDGEAEISNDEAHNLIVHEWFRGRKQALLADFVIGTVDQMLLAGLLRKHVMLRHLGLAGKAVVIDECHAYDAYMNYYMDHVLRWLGSYKVPVILLSATLPAKRRTEIVTAYVGKKNLISDDENWKTSRGYPLLTWTDGNEPHSMEIPYAGQRTKIIINRIRDEEIIENITEALTDGGCMGVIVNTVKRAQQLAVNIEAAISDARVLLFHSQFIAPDRAEREKDLLQRIGKNSTPEQRDRLIIIGTQVLEQSLDIDFDYLVTDLCPIDLLLQRIGRLHRHDRSRPAKLQQAFCSVMEVCGDDFLKESELIYERWLLKQTKELLPDMITLPDDISELVNEVYKESDQHDKDFDTFRLNIEKQQRKADQFCIPNPREKKTATIVGLLNTGHPGNTETAEASVRDGIQSISVLVMKQYQDGSIGFLPWIEGGAKVSRDRMPSLEEARKIARQKLNLPFILNIGTNSIKAINELEEKNKTMFPEWQQAGLLKGELILLLDENDQTELCGFHLTYDKEKGLIVTKGKEENERNKRYRIQSVG